MLQGLNWQSLVTPHLLPHTNHCALISERSEGNELKATRAKCLLWKR